MPDVIRMEIAGHSFRITGMNVMICRESDPSYEAFVRECGLHEQADFSINLEAGMMPDTRRFTKIFDSGESWSLFSHDSHHFIVLNPPGCGEHPAWVARFRHDMRTVTIYCGDILLKGENGSSAVSNPFRYPLDQLLLIYILAKEGGALIHAAGISLGGRGYIFPGRSGAGKSTISRLLSRCKDIEPLSDDRVIVRDREGALTVFGTPWPGEGGIAVNKGVPLGGVFFLTKGKDNRIERIGPGKALERFLPVISIPWYDREMTDAFLRFCDELISAVPVYELHFTPDSEVTDVFTRYVSQ